MRILFVNHFPLTGSGSGVYTANLAKSLSKLGHEVAIIFPENRKKYEMFDGITLYPVFFKNEEIIENVNQSEMNFPCFTTHPRSVFKFKNMTDEQKNEYEDLFFDKIENVINEFKPDIVHAQHVWVLAGISAKCCQMHNIPLIVTCHGTDLMGVNNERESDIKWGTNWANIAVNYANYIVTISKDNNKLAEELFTNIKEKTIWIRNGVDSNVFYIDDSIRKKDVLESLGIKSNFDKVVSFVGKLTEFKGVDILLDAVALYENEDTLTLIAGDGELRGKLEEKCRNLNLKNVVFLGNQPQDKLREIYNIANCSTVPSRREAFGLVAAEAMICGTPVIATNEGGLPDFVTQDVGILVNVDDSKGLAEAINDILMGNKVFDRQLVSNKIKESYSQDSLIHKFEKIYIDAIKDFKN